LFGRGLLYEEAREMVRRGSEIALAARHFAESEARRLAHWLGLERRREVDASARHVVAGELSLPEMEKRSGIVGRQPKGCGEGLGGFIESPAPFENQAE